MRISAVNESGVAHAAGTLQRRELKYRLNALQRAQLERALSARMQPDPNMRQGAYLVSSLYFDTPSRRDYFDKLNGAFSRRKLRLRCYGKPAPDAVFKLEEKYRRGDWMGKRSVLLPYETALQVMAGSYEGLCGLSPQADRFYALLAADCYAPVVSVRYVRRAFVLPQQDLRVTFDTEIRCSSAAGFAGGMADAVPDILSGEVILEVKYANAMPRWLADALRRIGADLSTKSKYADSIDRIYD